jgi:hypothetical protein
VGKYVYAKNASFYNDLSLIVSPCSAPLSGRKSKPAGACPYSYHYTGRDRRDVYRMSHVPWLATGAAVRLPCIP